MITVSDSESGVSSSLKTKRKRKTLGRYERKIGGLVTPRSTPKSHKRSTNVKSSPKPFVLPAEVEKITCTALADLHDLKRYTR
jgi:hypothetical protein